ncbi:MAG: ECF transporter S component [Firmicutes bacterium]|nr:ECF transporter S component [Bacillota bacterium]
MSEQSIRIRKIVYAAVCIALALVLPLLLGQVQIFMQGVSPMHIPALLCGLVCGPVYGVAVGFICPILRSAIFSMPVMYPTALAMAFELAAYGLLTGLFYQVFHKLGFWPRVYLSLILAMILGRFVGGIAQAILLGIKGEGYSLSMFATAYFAKTSVGMVVHLIVIPAVFFALKKAGLLIENGKKEA